MKTLNEILSEGVFDNNVKATGKDLVKAWIDSYVVDNLYTLNTPEYEIDDVKKKIILTYNFINSNIKIKTMQQYFFNN